MRKTAFILLMLLTGCVSKVAVHDQKLVVEGWIEAGEAPVVYVSTTMNPSAEELSVESLSDHIVKWAKVTLSDGENEVVLTGTASKRFFPPYAFTTGRMTGEVGKTYTLKVEYSGEVATAQATVPAPRSLDSVEVVPMGDNAEGHLLRVRFTDNPLTEDYYRFFTRIQGADSVFIPAPLAIVSDSMIENSAAQMDITPGGSIISSSWRGGFLSGDKVKLKFSTMDRGMYLFWKSFDEHYALSNLPIFSLDQNLPGNVSGGIGYFAGYGSTVYSIDIP